MPQMPPNPAPHITGWLVELGITESTGMGSVPISWRELNAWVTGTSLSLAPWEKRLLRRLSAAYLAESREAESEFRPPPWQGEVTIAEREADEADLISILG